MLEAEFEFIRTVDLLKSVERQTLTHSGSRRENTAEHSWHLAIAVMTFESHAREKIDLLKAVRMALVHDIVEIDAGDTFAFHEGADKAEKESAAADRIFAILPETLGNELHAAWKEFEERKTPESKYVAALDRFLPVYANLLNGGYSWKNHGITYDQVVAKIEGGLSDSVPTLWAELKLKLDPARSTGLFKDKE